MCERCDLIDYKVADIWRPCYVPPNKRAQAPGYIPTTPRGGFDDKDMAQLETIHRLSAIIRQQKAEIAALKAQQKQNKPDAQAFDGPEAA